jgi:hypothetical protein
VQSDVAHGGGLLQRDSLHVDGEVFLGGGGAERAGELLAALARQVDRRQARDHHEQEDGAEGDAQAAADAEITQDHLLLPVWGRRIICPPALLDSLLPQYVRGGKTGQ